MLEELAKHGQQGFFFFLFCSFCIQADWSYSQADSIQAASLGARGVCSEKREQSSIVISHFPKDCAVPSFDLIFHGISSPSNADAGPTNSASEISCTYGRY